MKIQQKVICSCGARDFAKEVNEHLDEGWRVAQGSMVRGNGDMVLCVVEHDVPEKMPCFTDSLRVDKV
jgi:hypothetical protein